MDFNQKLSRFAELVIKFGVNLQPGEELFLSAPITAAPLARDLITAAYKAGAKDTITVWNDEISSKIRIQNTALVDLCNIPKWVVNMRESIVDKRMCYVVIASEDPELYADVDASKVATFSRESRRNLAKFYDASMNNEIKWCVISAPSSAWAKKLFSADPDDVAVEKLWELIFKTMRVDEPDHIAAWKNHNENLKRHCDFLNNSNIKSLHYTNSIGTDFTVDLPKGYVFLGGAEKSAYGCSFNANMPTEEVFTAPDKYSANGTLVASMPLCHLGNTIKNFSLTFKNGAVTSFSAEQGYDTLKGIIDTDDGSKYLGEIALISYDTPIQKLKTLFLNTLFDENASCHFALGKAYPSTVSGTDNLSAEELDKLGVNTSLEHVDFMVGTEDLNIEALTHDGKKIQIFKNGNFTF
jgi:Leucyl aminopeptidase (aminopeptidase T)